MRPRPNNPKVDGELVFFTKYGHRWSRTTATGKPIDAIGHEFAKILKTVGIKREAVSFYALRHKFETIGCEKLDKASVNRIDALFRKSGLMWDKWDERHLSNGKTYGKA